MKDFDNINTVWGWTETTAGKAKYEWSYTAINNAIAGDTDSIMLSFPQSIVGDLDTDLAVEIADTIGELTNKAFPDFCIHAFNAPSDRASIIQTDREVVSDKSLFLSKKRYIMHIVDSEGQRVDKLKIMGVELKKSDTSKAIKTLLMELVLAILDGKTETELLPLIKEMKIRFKNFSPSEIAKPINVKTLKKCQDMYDTTGDMKGFPYQVRAAMFWNSLCGKTDKTIVPGDKVGLLYIKHPKSKYIAFPIDMTTFPEWFSELQVDYETEWTKAHNKLESYLASIGLDIQGRKDSIKQELFGF